LKVLPADEQLLTFQTLVAGDGQSVWIAKTKPRPRTRDPVLEGLLRYSLEPFEVTRRVGFEEIAGGKKSDWVSASGDFDATGSRLLLTSTAGAVFCDLTHGTLRLLWLDRIRIKNSSGREQLSGSGEFIYCGYGTHGAIDVFDGIDGHRWGTLQVPLLAEDNHFQITDVAAGGLLTVEETDKRVLVLRAPAYDNRR
jgi:hypothetical protein